MLELYSYTKQYKKSLKSTTVNVCDTIMFTGQIQIDDHLVDVKILKYSQSDIVFSFTNTENIIILNRHIKFNVSHLTTNVFVNRQINNEYVGVIQDILPSAIFISLYHHHFKILKSNNCKNKPGIMCISCRKKY